MAYLAASRSIYAIAEDLYNEVPEHAHLRGRVILLVSDELSEGVGGEADVLSKKGMAMFQSLHPGCEVAWVITLSLQAWDGATDDERRAILDHELSHCRRDEKCTPILAPHDIEEFAGCIKRNGLWTERLCLFFKQLDICTSVEGLRAGST